MLRPPRRRRDGCGGAAPRGAGRDAEAPASPPPAAPAGLIRWAGSPPPDGPDGLAQPPPESPDSRTRPSSSGERRLRWAIGITAGVLVVVLAALVATANDGDRQPGGQVTATTGSPVATTTTPPDGSTGTTSGNGAASPSLHPHLDDAGGARRTSRPLGPGAGERSGRPDGGGGRVEFLEFLRPDQRTGGRPAGSVACPDQATCTVVDPSRPSVRPRRLGDHHHRLGDIERPRLHLRRAADHPRGSPRARNCRSGAGPSGHSGLGQVRTPTLAPAKRELGAGDH